MRQSHRGTTACVLGALACVVREQTLIEIIGDATIQSIVGATEEVTDPAHCELPKVLPHPSPLPWGERSEGSGAEGGRGCALRRANMAMASMTAKKISTAALLQRTYGVLPA